MVDWVEVVWGGGFVLFGGNVIVGMVNIIIKDFIDNIFEVGINLVLINGEMFEYMLFVNGIIVDE